MNNFTGNEVIQFYTMFDDVIPYEILVGGSLKWLKV